MTEGTKTTTIGLLGATGKVGGWVLEMCLDKGYDVFVLARSPDKFQKFDHERKETNLTVVEGDATAVDGIRALLEATKNKKMDAIISTLGSPSNDILVMKKAAQALVEALTDNPPQSPRIIWMTSTGINEATDQAKSYSLMGSPSRWLFGYGFFGLLQFKFLIPYVIGQDLWDDMGFSEDVIRAEPDVLAKTVMVRPGNMWPVSEHPAFSEEWRKEGGDDLSYTWVGASDPPPGKWITRRAIAAALLELVDNDSYDGTAKSLF